MRSLKVVPMKVDLITYMGSDLSVVNAARVSMDKKHDVMEMGDERLINYLAAHKHWSPFAHASLSFRVKAPIFVARQLAKHQVGLSWNEVSRRYVDSEPEFYIPDMRERAANVKQGSKENQVQHAESFKMRMENVCAKALTAYEAMLYNNIAPEVARGVLPQCMMTEWVWTGTLYAFMRVIKLRLDPHAQKESQEIAQELAVHIQKLFPASYKALMELEGAASKAL